MHRVANRRRAAKVSPPPFLASRIEEEEEDDAAEDGASQARPRPAEDREPPAPEARAPERGNANLVMLWLLVPLVLVILWQVIFGSRT